MLEWYEGVVKMEWLNRINGAINYIEANLTGKIEYEEAAKIACSSLSRFQNMFMFITDITPSEYVRRRRMSLAGVELISEKIKVVDLSYKYGYESPEAFTRSFKAFHGISPQVARKYGKFIDYPRISFQLMITGGHFTMDANTQFETYKDILVKMEIIELPETLKFVGITNQGLENFQNIEVYHEKHKPLLMSKHDPYIEVGLSSNAFKDSWYTFGCQVSSLDDLPDGLVGLDTGLRRFACLTFRVPPTGDETASENLVGGDDGPGDGMQMAGDYLKEKWIPKNIDKLYNHNVCEYGNYNFIVKRADSDFQIIDPQTAEAKEEVTIYTWIEVYKVNIDEDPEMCFYIPLK
jgi:AraC-like DNA-binding protein